MKKVLIFFLLFIINNIAVAVLDTDWAMQDLNGMIVFTKYSDDNKAGILTLSVSKVLGDNLQIAGLLIEENTIMEILYNGTSKRYDLSANASLGGVVIMGYRATSLINDLYNAHTVKLYINNKLAYTFLLKNLTTLLNKYK